MSKREQKSILIEKFLKEELSEEELAEFRKLWDSDPVFVKEVRDYSRLKVALKASDRLEKDSKGIVDHLRNAFFKYQSVAAIMLLAVMLPLYLLLQGQKRAITPESPEVVILAKAYFIKPEARLKADAALAESLEAYQKGEFMQSIDLLKATSTATGRLFTGTLADLYFEAGKMNEARVHYTQELADHPQDSVTMWNSLMTDLLIGDFIETKETLRAWAQKTNSAYSEEANRLLLELE